MDLSALAWILCVLTSDTKRTKSILLVLTEGIVRARWGLQERRHAEQSPDLAVRRESLSCWKSAVLCLWVWYATWPGIRPGLYFERLEYHPKYPTLVWDPTLECDPPHGAQHGALGVSTWGSRWHIHRTHRRVRARRQRMHTCA
jgi:hypothetical protein